MPTTRPRYHVTESVELGAALDAAARRWPGLSRSRLLVKLALEGHRAALDEHTDRRQARLDAMRRSRGALSGAYEPGYLQAEREDWPA